MGCFITKSKCDDRLELAKIDTTREDLKTERKALEAEKVEFKVKMEMEEEEFQRTTEKERGKLKRMVKEIVHQQLIKLCITAEICYFSIYSQETDLLIPKRKEKIVITILVNQNMAINMYCLTMLTLFKVLQSKRLPFCSANIRHLTESDCNFNHWPSERRKRPLHLSASRGITGSCLNTTHHNNCHEVHTCFLGVP